MNRTKRLVLVLGLVGIADTALILAIRGGINLGTVLPGMVGVCFVVWAVLSPKTGLDFSFLRRWSVKTLLFYLFCLWLLSFVAVQAIILSHAFSRHHPETDWCIVLGAGLRGESPTLTLRKRLDTAAAYLEQYPDARAVVSGGLGTGATITEAEAMRRYLVDKGVGEHRIYKEEQATNTVQNLRYSAEIISGMDTSPEKRISVISNDFHLLRVRLLGWKLGIRLHPIPSPTPWYLLPNACIREYFALAKSALLDN